MADSVALRQERALPEYEQMKALKLFTGDEILKIKKKREELEYSINHPSRELKDYVAYIKYERSLITLTKERSRIAKNSQNHTIVPSIAKRMKYIYTEAISRFPQSIRFWDEFVKFLQLSRFTTDVSPAYDRMLQFHSNNVDAWIRAIFWEYNENYNDDRVKGLLLRAQQHHPKSEKLYATMLQIELENKRKAEPELALKHATVVYADGKEKFTKIDYFLEMLKIVDRFGYASALQATILEDLCDKFAHNERYWHTVAQRQLIDTKASADQLAEAMPTITLDDSDDSMEAGPSTGGPSKLNVSKEEAEIERLELCVETYEAAVQALDTRQMWTYYVDAMIELNRDGGRQAQFRRSLLGRAFKAATETGHMSEDHYQKYIELLFSDLDANKAELIKVFEQAVAKYETSLRLWSMYLTYYLHRNDYENVRAVFRRAKKILGRKSIPLWRKYLTYLRVQPANEQVAEFNRCMNEIVALQHAEYNELKAHIVTMHYKIGTIARARRIYKAFVDGMPNCYEVHAAMADLEAKCIPREKDHERRVLDTMVLTFGESRTDVWVRYMRFERDSGDPLNVSKLHERAQKSLKAHLQDDFNALYNFFTSNM